MTTQFGKRISPKSQAALRSEIGPTLIEGERILWLGAGQWLVPPAISHLVITNLRIFGWLHPGSKPVKPFLFREDVSIESSPKSRVIKVSSSDGGHNFRLGHTSDAEAMHSILQHAREVLGRHDIAEAGRALEAQIARVAKEKADFKDAGAALKERHKAQREGYRDLRKSQAEALVAWPSTDVVGGPVSKAASAAVRRQCIDDDPWLILASGVGGLLAAWDDRLAIIKAGAMTAFMAGSTGGERSSVYHFVDITGIEYNSGFANGVLEVLTASYDGGSNKDFWSGITKGQTEAAGDPFKNSNTLPLAKMQYNAASKQIAELRRKIGEAKRPQVHVTLDSLPGASAPASSLADEIRQLAELRDAGVLTDEEFAAAKARLL